MENNKIFDLLDKAIQILDRCWKGYKPVAGVKPYEAGSCEKEMATQSDMSEIEEVIAMLDKAINFYDPSQARDESGKWSGSGGGMAPDKGSPSGGSRKSSEKISKSSGDKKELPESASELIGRHNRKKGSEKLDEGDFDIDSDGDASLNGRGKAKLIISDVTSGQASTYITSGEAKSLKAYGVKLKGYDKSKDKGYGDGDGQSGYIWDKANIDAVKSHIKSNS